LKKGSVGHKFKNGIIQDLRYARAGYGDQGDYERGVEFTEIKENGFVRNTGYQELGWKTIEKKDEQVSALPDRSRGEPYNQESEDKTGLNDKKSGSSFVDRGSGCLI
jgi:hypothetical protein